MKRSLLAGTAILILEVCTPWSQAQKSQPVQLKVEVLSENHCQIISDVQTQRLVLKMVFENSSSEAIVIQEIHPVYRITLAKTLMDMERGIYAVDNEFEPGHPVILKNSSALTLKPGGVYSTTETVGVPVVRRGESEAGRNLEAVKPGAYYLRIGESLIVGDSPRNWHNLVIQSIPIAVRIHYSNTGVPGCQAPITGRQKSTKDGLGGSPLNHAVCLSRVVGKLTLPSTVADLDLGRMTS